jgi:carbamoyltransferase
MNVLGVSCYYHDAAACLVRDGKVLAAAEQERFSRRKHDFSFPAEAIQFCLASTGTLGRDLDAVAFYEKPLRKLERALVIGRQYQRQSEGLLSTELRQFVHEGAAVSRRLVDFLGLAGPVLYCEHHLSHAASAFFASPFSDAAVLTVDGVGEWSTVGQFLGTDRKLTLKREIRYPHSLGMFYATMTAYLGFEVNDGEYKVMGLASYGKPTMIEKIEELITLMPDGSFANNADYFSYMYSTDSMFSDRLVELLGPPRHANEPIEQRHIEIAASVQAVTERAMVNLARALRRYTDSPNLALAGGVAHNVVANTRILEDRTFKNLFVQPAPGDSGAAIGAALYAYYNALDQPRIVTREYDTCLGPCFTNGEIRAALDARRLRYEQLDSCELARRTARLIHQDIIVGWFQGRMEFGPRALGNRSIVANPCNPRMKDILNGRVKRREDFRPFAPAVLAEAATDFFDLPGPSPFMLMAPQVRKERAEQVPAVTHVDGSARAQTVTERLNPRFYRLISEFAKLSGVPVLINTSFNIRGEPIVCTPDDAINCFLGTDIDFLAIGDYLVQKPY